MADLKTKYMGIALKNPIIVGACGLVTDRDTLLKIEEAGAGAVVYKSLFEEQIQLEQFQHEEELAAYNDRNAEMSRIFPDIKHAGPEEHLNALRKAKASVKIPVIASLNAVNNETWLEYALKVQETGVDALELNFYNIPKEISKESQFIERRQIDIVKEIKNHITIPVSVKLSPYYANIMNVIGKIDDVGADGFVLFNRFFQPAIDIEKEQHTVKMNLTSQEDKGLSLRFAGLLYSQINGNICANTGIHTANDVIEMLLVGADVVQIVSTLYKNKVGYITTMLHELENWMDSKKYSSIDDFKGKLSKAKTKDPFTYKRTQYIDIIFNSKNFFDKQTFI